MMIAEWMTELSCTIHQDNVDVGWWDDCRASNAIDGTLEPVPSLVDQRVPEKLCLIHSEISEAMEGHRKSLMDDHLPHRKMVEVELADAMIRILDLAGALQLDIGGALTEKLEYNSKRADHKRKNREAPGGKAY